MLGTNFVCCLLLDMYRTICLSELPHWKHLPAASGNGFDEWTKTMSWKTTLYSWGELQSLVITLCWFITGSNPCHICSLIHIKILIGASLKTTLLNYFCYLLFLSFSLQVNIKLYRMDSNTELLAQCWSISVLCLPLTISGSSPSSWTSQQMIYVAALLCDLRIRPIHTAPVTAPLLACLLKTKPSVQNGNFPPT